MVRLVILVIEVMMVNVEQLVILVIKVFQVILVTKDQLEKLVQRGTKE